MLLRSYMLLLYAILLILFCCIDNAFGGCQNHCNGNGRCSRWNTCECFEGYEGNDCSRKICPTGPAFAAVPIDPYNAHPEIPCSGQGDCDYSSGLCKCYGGFSGLNCGRTECMGGCNGHGMCINLKTAAEENDGYRLNRTTTYSRWDAERIFGCKCDYGWSGADCSQRSCEYGIDPRLSDQAHETVTLVCSCPTGTCTGKFKVRMFDFTIPNWLKPSSTVGDLLSNIAKLPAVFQNTSTLSYPTVTSPNKFINETLCSPYKTIKTKVVFRRNHGNLPAMSFYANLIRHGSMYFETKETITCDCVHYHCNGTFRISFEGEMSQRLLGYSNGSEIISSLRKMQTLQNAGYTVFSNDLTNAPFCVVGHQRNITITFQGQVGNAPVISVWSSMVTNNEPTYYTTANTSNVLRVTTDDGRDEHMKLCNGIGSCDFSTGICTCPFGWTFDATLGVCGMLQVNTSRWNGLARCPGVIDTASIGASVKSSYDNKPNYMTLIYMSMNPANTNQKSRIYSFNWQPVSLKGAKILPQTAILFTELSSYRSAGPVALDQARDYLIYVDNNPDAVRTINFASQFDSTNQTAWLGLHYDIYAMSFDAHFKRRKLYWSVPQFNDVYYAYVDENSPPTVHSVKGQMAVPSNMHTPYGLGIHYVNYRLYWVDRNATGVKIHGQHVHSVLRSVSLIDYQSYEETFLFTTTEDGKYNISTNVTDLIMDFSFNNTAFFIDTAPNGKPAVYAVNLNRNIQYNTSDTYDSLFVYYKSPRLVINSVQGVGIYPKSLLLDETNQYILWSDFATGNVGYQRYKLHVDDTFSPGTAYQANQYYASHMVMDMGYGKPLFNSFDCYGNGKCLGLKGNFACECYDGYSGDCQVRECPKGKAWYHEPIVDEIAHDEVVDCSNRGTCDHVTGLCTCQFGYEGQACERLSCVGDNSTGQVCYGNGRCLSLRDLGYYHKNEFLEPEPLYYGPKSNDPGTWDADRIFGCLADDYGFYDNGNVKVPNSVGPHLKEYECPLGFNPRLTDKVATVDKMPYANFTMLQEIQRIHCVAHRGTFQLKFRGYVTDPIPASATPARFQTILQSLPTIGKVKVEMTRDIICSDFDDDHYTTITFISLLNRIPLLEVVNNDLAGLSNTVTVTRLQAVATEYVVECSGHGTCDRKTGLCECWEGYGTSDGVGNAGIRGDCGHLLF